MMYYCLPLSGSVTLIRIKGIKRMLGHFKKSRNRCMRLNCHQRPRVCFVVCAVCFFKGIFPTLPPPFFSLFLLFVLFSVTPLLSKNLAIRHRGGSATLQRPNKAELVLPGNQTSCPCGAAVGRAGCLPGRLLAASSSLMANTTEPGKAV